MTTTRDRNLQFQGAVSTGGSPLDFLRFFSSIYVQLSKTSPLKSGESSEKSSGENCVKSCHVCGCHGFFGPELSVTWCSFAHTSRCEMFSGIAGGGAHARFGSWVVSMCLSLPALEIDSSSSSLVSWTCIILMGSSSALSAICKLIIIGK